MPIQSKKDSPRRRTLITAWAKRAILIGCVAFCSCGVGLDDARPQIEFSTVPAASEGGPATVGIVSGRVVGARPGQQVVIFAKSGQWYVQPFVDAPFTAIAEDSTWTNSTHLGTDYAALLVGPDYQPPATLEEIPPASGDVLAVAVTKGTPSFLHSWWLRLSMLVAALLVVVGLHRVRMRLQARQLNIRFQERLAERTRIAQQLHDTLLQGFVGASYHLHVGIELLPPDSPARPVMDRAAKLMSEVIDEGRIALRGLSSPGYDESLDLEKALMNIPSDLAVCGQRSYKVTVEGRPRPLHPLIRDEVYAIVRQALVTSFRRTDTKSVDVRIVFGVRRLRVFVRDDGNEGSARVNGSGRDGSLDQRALRDKAERIGAKVKVSSRASSGTTVELSVPRQTAYRGVS